MSVMAAFLSAKINTRFIYFNKEFGLVCIFFSFYVQMNISQSRLLLITINVIDVKLVFHEQNCVYQI